MDSDEKLNIYNFNMNELWKGVLLAGLFLLSCNSFLEKELIFVPFNFIGPLYIVYNQDDGVDKTYHKNGAIIYNIPDCGVLKCNYAPNEGISFDMNKTVKVFYKNKDKIEGQLRLYNDSIDLRDLKPFDVVAQVKFSGKLTISSNGHKLEYPYLGIVVDTLKNFYNTKYENATLKQKLKECNDE